MSITKKIFKLKTWLMDLESNGVNLANSSFEWMSCMWMWKRNLKWCYDDTYARNKTYDKSCLFCLVLYCILYFVFRWCSLNIIKSVTIRLFVYAIPSSNTFIIIYQKIEAWHCFSFLKENISLCFSWDI